MLSKSTRKSPKEPNKVTIVILGEGGVGKSCMTLNYIRNEFSETYDPTIDDCYLTTIVLDGVEWMVEVIDTAGQEEYRGLWVEHALSQGDAFVLVYAINSESSLRILPSFLQNISINKSFEQSKSPIMNQAGQFMPELAEADINPKRYPFPFVIAGNKSDLRSQRTVPTHRGAQLAEATGGLFYECSAKEDVNVKEAFNDLIRATVRLRKLRAAHKKNPKTSNRPFIANIAYSNSVQSNQGNNSKSGSPSSATPSSSPPGGYQSSLRVQSPTLALKPPLNLSVTSPTEYPYSPGENGPQAGSQELNSLNDSNDIRALRLVNINQQRTSYEDGRFNFAPSNRKKSQNNSESPGGCSCLVN